MIRSAWHPLEIEERWMRVESHCHHYLQHKIPSQIAPLFGLILVALFGTFIDQLQFPAPNRGFLEMFRAGAWAIWTLLLVASLAPWWMSWVPAPDKSARNPTQISIFFALACLCWVISLETQAANFYSNPNTLRDLYWVYAIFPLWLALGLYFTRSKFHSLQNRMKWAMSICLLILPLIASLIAVRMAGQDQGKVLFSLWGPRPHTYFFLVMTLLFMKRSAPAGIIANPVHVLIPTLYPIETEFLRRQDAPWMANWWRGVMDVAKSLIICWLLMQALLGMFSDLEKYTMQWKLAISPVFSIFASMVVVLYQVGISRMLGVQSVDGTHFAPLAKSPLEYWKRDGVYPYQFALRFVFFPTLRIFKNPAFALFVAASVFLLNRTLFQGLLLTPLHQFASTELQSLPHTLNLYRVPIYYLSILLTVKFWFSAKSLEMSASRAWLGIVLTHLLNSLADWLLVLRHA
jgi:hypothetical protein